MSRIIPTARPSQFSLDDPPRPIPLVADRDAVETAGGWKATSDQPWLRIDVDAARFAGQWIELIFDTGLTDVVTRPMLRSVTPDGDRDEFLPAAALGRARWIGKIPRRTSAILVSPVNAPVSFAFRLVAARRLSLRQLAARGWTVRPKYVALGFGHRFLGSAIESERCFRRALHSAPIHAHHQWASPRRRAPEWDGFDSMREAESGGPHIRVVATDASRHEVERLLGWLRSQPWPHWSLAAPAAAALCDVIAIDRDAPFGALLADLGPDDLVLSVRTGDVWAAETLAVAGVAALRERSDLFYGDEVAGKGGLQLKPDWSPILARFTDLVGRAWIARAEWARRAIGDRRAVEAANDPLPVDDAVRVTHLRKVLLERGGSRSWTTLGGQRPAPVAPDDRPCATIVIPTRDRSDLLRLCVESLRRATGRSDCEAIVVDNGSSDRESLAYLRALDRDPRFRVLERPGPFNFSRLCNAGAAEARAPTLVFLNNDIEAPASDWLDLLVGWAGLPTIGAVGAKLVYPDGRLQHAGVVLGIDGHVNHFERFRPPDDPGFFGRINFPHEISAVTGACLAVEKRKFDAVGGFDEVNLPVEFSDIDLCLRLAERGWTALIEPAALLVHREAASRKIWRSQEKRYAGQVAYFKERWRNRLRDDPYFHPALSLDWHTAALG